MTNNIAEIINLIKDLNTDDKQKLKVSLNKLLDIESSEKETAVSVIEVPKEKKYLCPHCGSKSIVGFGKYKNRQRYVCRECSKTFNEYTGTAVAGTHYISKWKEYIKCMIDEMSIRAICEKLQISIQTSFDWRHKILNSFKKIGCEKFEGIIESDETFFLYSEKGKRGIINRKARRRGGVSKKRGISDEQVAVVTACDREKNIKIEAAAMGRISEKDIDKVIGNKVNKNNILCCDGHNSYKAFAKNKNMSIEIIKSTEKARVKEKIYHIQNVNNLHSRMKEWFEKFHGVATKYLNNYLNGFSAILKIKKEKGIDKVNKLLDIVCKDSEYKTAIDIRKGYTQFFRT